MTVQIENSSSKKSDCIRVIVACHYPLLREGISNILADDEDIQVISNVSNLLDLVQACEECKLDVLLLDVDLQGLNLTKILQLLKRNKHAKVILIINGSYNENTLVNAIRSGVRGYLLKNADSYRLIKAIKAVDDGELWVERKMMVKVLDSFSSPRRGRRKKGEEPIYDLTETEAKIVKLVLTGLSNKDIAKDLYLSEKTVKFHLYKIFKKLSVKNRSELILYGFRNGLVS
jgi:Response regulator containing a CheY-like receiver domain and an HTH DNA-binding domain